MPAVATPTPGRQDQPALHVTDRQPNPRSPYPCRSTHRVRTLARLPARPTRPFRPALLKRRICRHPHQTTCLADPANRPHPPAPYDCPSQGRCCPIPPTPPCTHIPADTPPRPSGPQVKTLTHWHPRQLGPNHHQPTTLRSRAPTQADPGRQAMATRPDRHTVPTSPRQATSSQTAARRADKPICSDRASPPPNLTLLSLPTRHAFPRLARVPARQFSCTAIPDDPAHRHPT